MGITSNKSAKETTSTQPQRASVNQELYLLLAKQVFDVDRKLRFPLTEKEIADGVTYLYNETWDQWGEEEFQQLLTVAKRRLLRRHEEEQGSAFPDR